MYWIEPEVFECEVDVKAVADCKVRIDPVIFHPDEGGQPANQRIAKLTCASRMSLRSCTIP